MIIICGLLSKLFFIIFVLAMLNIIRHVYLLIAKVMDDEDNTKYQITPKALLFLGLSVALVITGFITGVGICV